MEAPDRARAWGAQGVSWRLGYTASDLVTSGQLPPFIICAVDSAGPMRSLNYLPFPPGTGAGGFRGDCERWRAPPRRPCLPSSLPCFCPTLFSPDNTLPHAVLTLPSSQSIDQRANSKGSDLHFTIKQQSSCRS